MLKDENKSLLIRQILSKLRKMLSQSPSTLNEQVSIFKILGAVRGTNIEQLIKKEEQNMPIILDVSKTLFYQQALREGIEKGIEKGVEQGIEKVVTNMLEAKVPIATIQTYTGLSKKELQKIMKEHKAGN